MLRRSSRSRASSTTGPGPPVRPQPALVALVEAEPPVCCRTSAPAVLAPPAPSDPPAWVDGSEWDSIFVGRSRKFEYGSDRWTGTIVGHPLTIAAFEHPVRQDQARPVGHLADRHAFAITGPRWKTEPLWQQLGSAVLSADHFTPACLRRGPSIGSQRIVPKTRSSGYDYWGALTGGDKESSRGVLRESEPFEFPTEQAQS